MAGAASDFLLRGADVDVISAALIDASAQINTSLRRIDFPPSC